MSMVVIIFGIFALAFGACAWLFFSWWSALRKTLRTMQSEKELFRTIADFSCDWEYLQDADGRLLYISPSCERLTGYAPEQFMEHSGLLLDIIHPEDRRLFQAQYEGPGASRQEHQLDFRIVSKQGKERWISHRSCPVFDSRGAFIGRRGQHRDATEQKKKADLLTRQQEELRRWESVFSHAGWGIAITQPHPDRYELLNPEFFRMHGYAENELNTCPVEQFFPPSALEKLPGFLDQAHAHGQHSFELEHLRKDGSTFPCRMDVATIKDAHGAVLYRVDMVQDLSKRKQFEETLLLTTEKAEVANRAKSEFLTNISHEVRTPLNGLFGMLQLLEDTPLNEEQKEYVGAALTTGRNLLTILNDILNFTKLETGEYKLRQEPFCIRAICESVRGAFALNAMDKGLDFTVQVDDAVPQELLGDERRVRQILVNIVGNAIKFTEQGSVSLHIYLLPHRKNAEDVLIGCEVTDTGIGIEEEKLTQVFTPFTQADMSYTRRYGGLGLGLGFVKRLVELMDGNIWVDTLPQEGTTVFVSLHLARTSEIKDREDEHSDEERTRALHVLIVEDDMANMLAISRFMEKKGWRISNAYNGREALDILGKEQVDCIIMDIQMPVMNGVEATKKIRTSPQYSRRAKTPIIALTAFALDSEKDMYLQIGMDDYITKPVNLEDLYSVVNRLAH